MPIINHLYKSFGEKQVISDFSLCFEPYERICISGASGKGKTTLLRLICGLEKPDKGELLGFDGALFSMLFQEDRLIEGMNAEDNVALVCHLPKHLIRDELEEMGISEFNLPVFKFSGGMKRRVALCRAMLAKANFLLLDEPYKGLDQLTRQKVMQTCEKHMENKTIFMVTHQIEEAKAWRHIVLE